MTETSAATPITRAIPGTGESLPVIGLGTWQTFDVGTTRPELAPLEDVMRTFVAGQCRLVDSSPMYGHAETVLGELMATLHLRPRLFVATKVWTSGQAAGIAQIEASMRKLQCQTLDLMQVHNLLDVATHLRTLREYKERGLVRYIGITHYNASAHRAVAQVLQTEPVDFVQINYSVFEREAEDHVLPLAQEREVAVIANRPFASGAALRHLRGRPLPGWAAELGCDSWPQLLLKFIIAHPAVTCTIPATSTAAHMRDNVMAGTGRLPDSAQRERIAAAIS
jgi:diketogulonate reductase-like aldo/keto reductase